MQINQIIKGNCYDLIKDIADNSIDAIVTDPPYEMKMGGGGCFKDRQYWADISDNDLHIGFDLSLLTEFKRVLKQINMVIFCNKNQLRNYINWIYENKYNWMLITMNKTNPIPATNNCYLPDTEYILHIWEKGCLYGEYETKARYYLTQVNKNNIDHPTVKPLNVISNMIINASKENDLILDPFIGSGTTAIACERLNRRWLGFEIDNKYYDLASARIEAERNQGKLLL